MDAFCNYLVLILKISKNNASASDSGRKKIYSFYSSGTGTGKKEQ
jgi:hypothetical protein